MRDIDITLLTVSWNQKEVLELMLKSYVRYHHFNNPLKLLLWDNASTDGTVEWLIQNKIPFIKSETNIGHEQAVNACYTSISTKYCLLSDTDIIYKSMVWYYINEFSPRIVAAGDLIQGDSLNSPIKPRLGAWFILFDIDTCRQHGITYFRNNTGWNYDVGSQFYENLWMNNLQPVLIPRLPGNMDADLIGMSYEKFDHLLRMSWNLDNHGDRRDEVNRRKDFVLEKLKEYDDIDLKGKFV